MSEKYYVGKDVTSFSDKGKYKPISRVTLLVDDENSLTAGDDTGMEVVASCPHATQPMVNALLQTMKGYQYQAYEAGAANIDPAAELGDGVTVCGIYSPLSKLSDDGRGYADISSPGELEMEDEYPSDGYITQEFNRKIAETRSTITKTSEEIMLKVNGIDGEYTELKTTVDGVTITDQSGTTKIKGSSIDTASIAANAISADQVNLTGAITWSDLSDEAQQRVDSGKGDDNPSYIKSSYIDSAKIVSPNIYGGLFYATGQGKNNGAAYYIYDGADIDKYGNVTLGNKIGFISYDTSGTGYDAPRRVIFKTLNDEALKLEAAGNMSLQAKDYIFVHTPLHLASGVHYGTVLPSEGLSPGRLFFLLDE